MAPAPNSAEEESGHCHPHVVGTTGHVLPLAGGKDGRGIRDHLPRK
jgi:hypothetical protein